MYRNTFWQFSKVHVEFSENMIWFMCLNFTAESMVELHGQIVGGNAEMWEQLSWGSTSWLVSQGDIVTYTGWWIITMGMNMNGDWFDNLRESYPCTLYCTKNKWCQKQTKPSRYLYFKWVKGLHGLWTKSCQAIRGPVNCTICTGLIFPDSQDCNRCIHPMLGILSLWDGFCPISEREHGHLKIASLSSHYQPDELCNWIHWFPCADNFFTKWYTS